MPQEPKLPPLLEESLDGYREEAAIHRDRPLDKTCNHHGVYFVSGSEIKCGCGAGWTGQNVVKLYKAFKELS